MIKVSLVDKMGSGMVQLKKQEQGQHLPYHLEMTQVLVCGLQAMESLAQSMNLSEHVHSHRT